MVFNRDKYPCAVNNAMRLLWTILGFSAAYFGVPGKNPVRRITEDEGLV